MTRPASRAPRELFLSHSHRDLAFASRLAGALRDHGVPVWYSNTEIRGSQQWHDEIGQALRRCDWFLVLLSPASVKSQWVQMEYLYFLSKPDGRNRIIPVRLRPCKIERLSWTIEGTFQIVSMDSGYENSVRDVLRVWGLGYRGG